MPIRFLGDPETRVRERGTPISYSHNKNMMFFFRNFGGNPAKCFRAAHAVEMIDTFTRIEQELFPGCTTNPIGGVVGHPRWVLDERFGAQHLPEGYFYFLISSGGLEIRNLLLEILALERCLKPLVGSGIEDVANGSDSEEWASLAKDTKMGVDTEDAETYACSTASDIRFFVEEDYLAEQKSSKRVEYDQKAYAWSKEVWDEDKTRTKTSAGCDTVKPFLMKSSCRSQSTPPFASPGCETGETRIAICSFRSAIGRSCY